MGEGPGPGDGGGPRVRCNHFSHLWKEDAAPPQRITTTCSFLASFTCPVLSAGAITISGIFAHFERIPGGVTGQMFGCPARRALDANESTDPERETGPFLLVSALPPLCSRHRRSPGSQGAVTVLLRRSWIQGPCHRVQLPHSQGSFKFGSSPCWSSADG
jgi:hypothetical protein